jgi:dihydropteroate synthase
MTIRLLQVEGENELKKMFQMLKVDPYGIRIMLPKAINYLIKLSSLSSIAANILKQEMLSLGGDVALPRDVLTVRTKKTDCLLIGTLSQIKRLNEKLKLQPFGLNKLAQILSLALNNYEKDKFVLDLGKTRLKIGHPALIMGVVNLTPDSFSGDGLYQSRSTRLHPHEVLEHVEKMVKDGADIIDLGGESSRPGAGRVSVKEELTRTIPVIKLLSKKIRVPISIDTYKPEVAEQALDNGAVIINDITGLRNARMARIIAKYNAACVIMHMKGRPATMQRNPVYKSLIEEIIAFLSASLKHAVDAGVTEKKIIIDPGIGFGKTLEQNLEILKRLKEFKILGRPIIVGTSRKSFIGKILNVAPLERIFGTVASNVLAVQNGANIVRAHDIKAVSQALKVGDCILN